MVLGCLVVAALAAIYEFAAVSRPTSLTTRTTASQQLSATVTQITQACAAPGSGGVTADSLAIGSAPGAHAGSGQAAVTALSPSASPAGGTVLRTITTPGQLDIARIPEGPAPDSARVAASQSASGTGTAGSGTAGSGSKSGSAADSATAGLPVPTRLARGGVIVTATSALAQGLDVEQLTPSGMLAGRCGQPGTSFWFTGSASSGTTLDLYLINVDSQTAEANVNIQTDSGNPLLGKVQDTGISVPPHSMIMQPMHTLLHAARAVALHVTTSTGRVVAAVRETSSSGKPGIWIPAGHAPATTQIIPGMPNTAGTRDLYVAVPGVSGALVKVTAITPHGSYQPTGGSGVSLPGGSAFMVGLPSLAGIPAAIRVTSTVPVTATMMISGGPSGAPGAMVTGADPIVGQGLVAGAPMGAAGTSELVLSAPGHAGQVQVSVVAPGTAVSGQAGQKVKVPAGKSTVVPLRLPKGVHARNAEVLVTVAPGSGPVYGGLVAGSSGTGIIYAITPVITSLDRVPLQRVVDSLLTISP